ncbi:MAG: hypothetical protein QOI66_3165 [Myxococcales bacterium]|jgi:hypothetical protein|nr:hypothetical protein [Myxococcales bacterium]
MRRGLFLILCSVISACTASIEGARTGGKNDGPGPTQNDGGSGGGSPDGGPPAANDAAAMDVGPPDQLGQPGDDAGDPDAFRLIWPNETSAANSDPWLMAHHEEITELRPRALILHFANGHNINAIMARWNLMALAFSEGSTYHAYSNPAARPFVTHQLVKLVDLTDRVVPPGWTAPNSTKMPRLNGGIDFGQLYNQTYADLYAFPDPANPAHNLTLCELIQKGVINELFVAFNKTGTDGNVPEIIEYKQIYDANDRPIPGRFDPYAGNGNFEPADLPQAKACGRSLRVDFIEMTGIISGAMHVFSHNIEHMGERTLPSYRRFYYPFFNMDFDARFQTPFRDWYGVSVNGTAGNFITYSGPNVARWTCPSDSSCAGRSGTMDPLDQGYGNSHYAPNSRNSYDMGNTQMVMTRCEHYGLQDGPGGKDLQSPYSSATVAKLAAKYGSDGNGGGWQVYLYQSLPGYHSGAKLPDGTPIKNFWPYLFY